LAEMIDLKHCSEMWSCWTLKHIVNDDHLSL